MLSTSRSPGNRAAQTVSPVHCLRYSSGSSPVGVPPQPHLATTVEWDVEEPVAGTWHRRPGDLRRQGARGHLVSRRQLFRGVGVMGTLGAAGALSSSGGTVSDPGSAVATPAPRRGGSGEGFIHVSAEEGSDAHAGSVAAPLHTIQAAVTLAQRSGGGRHILVGAGVYRETVTVTGQGIRISGCGSEPYGTLVQAPGDTSSIFVIRGAGTWIENLSVTASSPRWDGVAFDLDRAFYARLVKIKGENDGVGLRPSARLGGTALRIGSSEGVCCEHLDLSWFRIAVHLLAEASDNVFTNVRGAANWQALVEEPGGGGNLVQHWKTTGSGDPATPSLVVDVGGDGNVFVDVDWDESGGNLVHIGGEGQHLFLGPTFAPGTVVDVTSPHNTFLHPTVLGTMNLRSDRNRCQDAHLPGGVLHDLGRGNLIENPDGTVR
jgi:hypothetical protein